MLVLLFGNKADNARLESRLEREKPVVDYRLYHPSSYFDGEEWVEVTPPYDKGFVIPLSSLYDMLGGNLESVPPIVSVGDACNREEEAYVAVIRSVQ